MTRCARYRIEKLAKGEPAPVSHPNCGEAPGEGRREPPVNSPHFWIEALGLLAACLTTSSFLPQALRIWRTRSARDVSLVMYVMMAAGNSLWLSYGILMESVSMIFANATCLLMVVSVLVLKVRDMMQPNLLVEIVAAEAAVGTPGPPGQFQRSPPRPPRPRSPPLKPPAPPSRGSGFSFAPQLRSMSISKWKRCASARSTRLQLRPEPSRDGEAQGPHADHAEADPIRQPRLPPGRS